MNSINREQMLEIMKNKLKPNLNKLTKIAKQNTIYNEQGYAVLSADDEWRSIDDRDEFYGRVFTTEN